MIDEPLALDEVAHAVWQELATAGPLEIEVLVERTRTDQARIMATAAAALSRGFMRLVEQPREELVAGPGASAALAAGLPERHTLDMLAAREGAADVAAMATWARGVGLRLNEVIRWGGARGWYRRQGDGHSKETECLVLTPAGWSALGRPDVDEEVLPLTAVGPIYLDQLDGMGLDRDRLCMLLSGRPEIGRIKLRIQRSLELTKEGAAAFKRGFELRKERNQLTPEDLRSGAWRKIRLRPYDVTLPARAVHPVKIHPLRKIIEETRRAFLEMGFTEVVSPMVESAFWNFDALFQPQDHPARDMQDTFYLEPPERASLPDADLVERVGRTHQDGWETGSEGWGYRWSAEKARRLVLRTHTTAATIRALAHHPEPPLKVFCIGWTYRNETPSYRHLPVFHQVDGVVIDREASLATLLGTLREFYRKLGIDEVKFKPAFFPYTEPSAEVLVQFQRRGSWMEMGGSGVLRPEVTRPMGCRYPVLAWGLGVERLAMLRYGLDTIRDLYQAGIDQLQEIALCR